MPKRKNRPKIKISDVMLIGRLLSNIERKYGSGVMHVVAAIITALLVTAMVLGSSVFGGCSAIKTRSVLDDVETVTGHVYTVCTTAEVFDSVGLGIPGLSVCQRAIQAMDSKYYPVIFDTARCVEVHEDNDEELIRCVGGVEGWPDVAKELVKW